MFPGSGKLLLTLTWGLAFLAAGCATAPYTGRRQLLLTSEGRETSMGLQAFSEAKRRLPLCPDPELNEMVQRVGGRLAAAANRPDYRWEFVVFKNDKEANAFCLPGGKVGIFTGLLKYTGDEAGLAAVMAHEAAHAIARHTGERMSQSMLAQVGGLGLGLGLGGVNPAAGQAIMQGYGLGTQMGILLPYSRSQEQEADRIGMILLAKAGYDPAAALDFWKRMMAKERGSNLPQFLSTHPRDDQRLKEMAAFLPEAQKYYQPPAAVYAPYAAPAAPLPGREPQAQAPRELQPAPAPPPRPPGESPSPPRQSQPGEEPRPHDDLEMQPMSSGRAAVQVQSTPACGQWVPAGK
jgi:predicted Zn-dependent protease